METNKQTNKWQAINRERRRVLFAIDTLKFNCPGCTACSQEYCRYYPDGSSSINKYFNTHTHGH